MRFAGLCARMTREVIRHARTLLCRIPQKAIAQIRCGSEMQTTDADTRETIVDGCLVQQTLEDYI